MKIWLLAVVTVFTSVNVAMASDFEDPFSSVTQGTSETSVPSQDAIAMLNVPYRASLSIEGESARTIYEMLRDQGKLAEVARSTHRAVFILGRGVLCSRTQGARPRFKCELSIEPSGEPTAPQIPHDVVPAGR